MITLKNNFHNTTCKTKGGILSIATRNRIRRTLCGIEGCQCSNELGIRGPQDNVTITEVLVDGEISFKIT